MIELIIEAAGAPERAYVIVSTAGDPKPLKEGEDAPPPEDIPKQQFPNAEEKLKNPLTSAEKIEYLKKMFPGVNFVSAKEASGGGPLGGWAYVKEKKECTGILLVAGSDRKKEFDPEEAYKTALTHMWDNQLKLKKWEIPLNAEGKKLKRKDEGYDPSPEEADRIMKENDKKRPNLTDPEIRVPKFVEAPRPDGAMSGTTARKLAVDGNFEGFKTAVNVGGISDDEIKAMYTKIREVCTDESLLKRAAEQRANREQRAAAAAAEAEAGEAKKRGPRRARRGGGESEEEEVSFFSADDEPSEGGHRRRTYRRCRKCGLPKKPETQ